MSCFLKECQNFFCENCQVLYFLFVHLRLTDGYISVFQIEAKRWMPFPFGFRAHSALPILYSVFLISLPIFPGFAVGLMPAGCGRSIRPAGQTDHTSAAQQHGILPFLLRPALSPQCLLHADHFPIPPPAAPRSCAPPWRSPGHTGDDLRVALVQCGQFFHHSRACKLHLRHAGVLIL